MLPRDRVIRRNRVRHLAVCRIGSYGTAPVTATLGALRQFRPDLSKATIAIVGASGVIGAALMLYFRARRDEIGKLMQFARTKSRITESADVVTILSSKELAELAEADVVIFATSSEVPIVTAPNAHVFKQGAVILDLAVPVDVAGEVIIARPDIHLVRCGLIRLPGHARSPVDFHFGEVGVHQFFPACLAQGLLLASTGRYENASQGGGKAIDADLIDWFAEVGRQYGCRVHASIVDERGIWSGVSHGN